MISPLRFGGPFDDVEVGDVAAAVGVHVPPFGWIVGHPTTGIDGDHDTLAAELVGDLANRLGTVDGRSVE